MPYRMARPINFDSRSMPYDFRARQIRRGLAGLAAIRRGMGDTDAYGNPITCPTGMHYAGGACINDCGTIDTSTAAGIAAQFACVQNNDRIWNDAYVKQTGGETQIFEQPNGTWAPGTFTPNVGFQALAQTTTPPPSGTPRLSFTTSRGGSSLQPGDTWQIAIAGAQPNQPVKVVGVHPDGGTAAANFGSTDASGNFTLTGTITADMAGHWQETWYVGAQQVGAFSFDVGIAAGSGSGSGSGSGGSGSGATPPPATPPAATFSFSDIPWWGWAAGGLGLFLATKGK